MSGLVTHGPGEHPWLTACGQDRANVVRWTYRLEHITCPGCLGVLQPQI